MSAVQVGDMGVKVLQKRGKRVRQKAREAKGLIGAPGGDEMENSEESDAEVEDDNSASTPKRLPLDSLLQSELYHSFPNSHRLYDYYEGNSFDPQVLTENDVAWLRQCRTLGFNSVMEKAYITGLGLYTGWGTFETNDGGIDPIDPYCGVVKGYPCYVEDGGDIDDPTYPFHEACYTIFAKYLGSSDPADIEKDVMYKTARKLFGNGRRSLMVDYGVDGGEQFWANQPGEEYIVTCPEDAGLELRETIWKRIPPSLLLIVPQPDLTPKVHHDPFTHLPFDLLQATIQYLSVPDAFSLMKASHHVSVTTREPMFWRSMIRTHLALWFWEIQNLVTADETSGLDYKGPVAECCG